MSQRLIPRSQLICLAFFVFTSPAFAAGGGGDGVAVDNPQFATFIAAGGVFLAVLFILKGKAWGPLMQALDERERKIQESLQAAEKAAEETKKAAAENERVLSDARKEASAIVEEGKRDAEAVRDRIVAEAREGAEDIKNRALADIERAKDVAVHEVHQRAVELSIAISKKLISKTLTASDHEALINEAIQSYEQSGAAG